MMGHGRRSDADEVHHVGTRADGLAWAILPCMSWAVMSWQAGLFLWAGQFRGPPNPWLETIFSNIQSCSDLENINSIFPDL
jgi:hypothetical protein